MKLESEGRDAEMDRIMASQTSEKEVEELTKEETTKKGSEPAI